MRSISILMNSATHLYTHTHTHTHTKALLFNSNATTYEATQQHLPLFVTVKESSEPEKTGEASTGRMYDYSLRLKQSQKQAGQKRGKWVERVGGLN